MNLFDLHSRGAPVYVDGVQIAQKPRAVQMNLFDLYSRGAPVYVDGVQIAQKPRAVQKFCIFVASCGSRFWSLFLFALYHNGIESRELLPLWQEVGSATASKQPTGGVACVRTCRNVTGLRETLPLWKLVGCLMSYEKIFYICRRIGYRLIKSKSHAQNECPCLCSCSSCACMRFLRIPLREKFNGPGR